MDPLFSYFDHEMAPENPKDFEEMMNKTLELGSLSSQTMHSTLQLPDLNECRDSDSGQHATSLEKLEVNPYFPPPSPVSPDASLLALNFDSKDRTEGSADLQQQANGGTSPVQNRIDISYPVHSNTLDNLSGSYEGLCTENGDERSKPRSTGTREAQGLLDVKNRARLAQELRNGRTEYSNLQTCSEARTVTPANSYEKIFSEMRQKLSTQHMASSRQVLDYENPEHGIQALLQLLRESSDPPRKKLKTGHCLSYVEEPGIHTQAMCKTAPTPGVITALAKELAAKQSTTILKSQPPIDAWTDLLQIGERADIICNPPALQEPPHHIPECLPDALQPHTGTVSVMPVTDEEPKLRFSSPLDDAWFLYHNPTTSMNSPNIQCLGPSNDPENTASSKVIRKHDAQISGSTEQPRSVVPQLGHQIEILYPSALGNKSPKAVRTLLRASADDIVSKIELYWSNFHDFHFSAERAGRLLREKSVRFERRKRMGPEVPAIEKKAIRAQRNRERSQALRRYHKQRMGDLEEASEQLKLYNSVAKSFINCLLEEPQSLELVQEYFSSHECNEELLTYLRGSL